MKITIQEFDSKNSQKIIVSHCSITDLIKHFGSECNIPFDPEDHIKITIQNGVDEDGKKVLESMMLSDISTLYLTLKDFYDKNQLRKSNNNWNE